MLYYCIVCKLIQPIGCHTNKIIIIKRHLLMNEFLCSCSTQVGNVYGCPLSRSCIYWVIRVGGRSWCRQWVGLVILEKRVWSAFSVICLKVKSCWLTPQRNERLRNASILPSCSLETKLLQAGAAFAMRAIMIDWNTISNCLIDRPWSRSCFNKYKRWLHILRTYDTCKSVLRLFLKITPSNLASQTRSTPVITHASSVRRGLGRRKTNSLVFPASYLFSLAGVAKNLSQVCNMTECKLESFIENLGFPINYIHDKRLWIKYQVLLRQTKYKSVIMSNIYK